MGFCFRQWINVLQGWVFIFRFGMVFSGVRFPFMSHRASTSKANLRRTMLFTDLRSSGFWFFGGEVMFLKAGFLFSGMGWYFPEWVFHFRTTVVPAAAIYFGGSSFSHMGFGRKKKKRCKVAVVVIFEITKEMLWNLGGPKVMRWLAT